MESTDPHIRRIAVVGPESSGKTTLCRLLAEAYDTAWVPEFAREYVASLGRPYVFDDLEYIGNEQVKQEERMAREAADNGSSLIFCDTELISISVWSLYCYQRVAPWIEMQIPRQQHDLYLLLAPDIPWEPDPLRENPDDRDVLFALFKQQLQRWNKTYRLITGSNDLRLSAAKSTIDEFLQQKTGR